MDIEARLRKLESRYRAALSAMVAAFSHISVEKLRSQHGNIAPTGAPERPARASLTAPPHPGV